MRQSNVQKWLTLIGLSCSTFSNAIGFGIYFTNVRTFALYYDVSIDTIQYTFFIGLVFELVFCLPGMKLVEWRLDFSMMCASFLSTSAYFLQYIAQGNIVVVVLCLGLLAFGQAMLVPMGPYLAERWFPLQQRSFAIAATFYCNLLGFTFGAVFTTLYVNDVSRVEKEVLIIAIISTFCLIVTILLVKNKPKKLIEKYKTVTLKQFKQLWKHRFNTYLIIMTSVFLGLSWTFLSQLDYLTKILSPLKLSILMIVWIVSGSVFGLAMSGVCNWQVKKNGDFSTFDKISKLLLFMGLVGYFIMGLCYSYEFDSFVGYIFIVIFISLGSIGFFGLMFMSIIQTFYPISSLLIGNMLVVGASFYAALTSALSYFSKLNAFYVLAVTGILPFLYVAITYKTNFKRYKYNLDEENSKKYVLIKIQDLKTQFNERKYE